MLLMILTLGNAAYLFSRFKTYDMQLRSVSPLRIFLNRVLTDVQAQEPIHSPHASPVPAPKIKAKKDKDSDVFDSQSDETPSVAKALDGKKVATMEILD